MKEFLPASVFNRREAEINSLNSKLESEQSLVAQLQKKIKELQVDWLSPTGSVDRYLRILGPA